MKKILFVFILSLLFFFLFFNVIQARGLVPCGGCATDFVDGECPTPEPACTLCYLFVLFGNVMDFLLFKIIPPLAALMVAIGGFMMIFAYSGPFADAGGGKKGPALLSQAKTLFKSVVIGLIIAYAAWLIVEAFFAAIGVKPWFGDWHTICS